MVPALALRNRQGFDLSRRSITLNSGLDENHTLPLAAFERNHAPAHKNLAQVMLELGQREQALIHAHIAVELGGDYLETFRATLLSIEATN